MELKVDIGFDQLLDAIKHLPDEQRKIVKAELDKKTTEKKKPVKKRSEEKKELTDYQKFLLNFPVMSDEQYKEYKQIRKNLNKWRTI